MGNLVDLVTYIVQYIRVEESTMGIMFIFNVLFSALRHPIHLTFDVAMLKRMEKCGGPHATGQEKQ